MIESNSLKPAGEMFPLNWTASPWETASVLFQRPDGGIWPYDLAGGAEPPLVCDVLYAPPGSGMSLMPKTKPLGLSVNGNSAAQPSGLAAE